MEHWERLFTSQKQLITTNNVFELNILKIESKKYLEIINKSFYSYHY